MSSKLHNDMAWCVRDLLVTPLPLSPLYASILHWKPFLAFRCSEDGFEIPTTTIVGMEIMEGFSDHGSYDEGCDGSLSTSAVV